MVKGTLRKLILAVGFTFIGVGISSSVGEAQRAGGGGGKKSRCKAVEVVNAKVQAGGKVVCQRVGHVKVVWECQYGFDAKKGTYKRTIRRTSTSNCVTSCGDGDVDKDLGEVCEKDRDCGRGRRCSSDCKKCLKPCPKLKNECGSRVAPDARTNTMKYVGGTPKAGDFCTKEPPPPSGTASTKGECYYDPSDKINPCKRSLQEKYGRCTEGKVEVPESGSCPGLVCTPGGTAHGTVPCDITECPCSNPSVRQCTTPEDCKALAAKRNLPVQQMKASDFACNKQTCVCAFSGKCGNGVLDEKEECDARGKRSAEGAKYGCQSLGRNLFCNEACKCIPLCGNNIIDPEEECDPTGPPSEKCVARFGHDYTCSSDCQRCGKGGGGGGGGGTTVTTVNIEVKTTATTSTGQTTTEQGGSFDVSISVTKQEKAAPSGAEAGGGTEGDK